MYTYELDYKDKQELFDALQPLTLRPRDLCEVRVGGGTLYKFEYMATVGDQITGRSTVRNAQVILDPDTMTLIEQ